MIKISKCPFCGKTLPKKKMKLPNGFGSIVYKDDDKRRPYAVRKSIDGKQKEIAYFTTYEEAFMFLVSYNKHPAMYSDITFDQCYQLMAKERYPKIKDNSIRNYESAYKHCTAVKSKRLRDIRLLDLQQVIDNVQAGYAVQRKIRSLFHNVYNYAMKYDLVETDYSARLTICKRIVKYPKQPFSYKEIEKLRTLAETNDWAKCVVMLCYTGCRATEFISITKDMVNVKQRFLTIGESKTEAGTNRIIPLHKSIIPYVEYFMKKDGETLITEDGHPIVYHRFKLVFDRLMKQVKMKHSPHECRHTLATMLDDVGANDVAVKKILGHSIKDITKGIYTHKSLDDLRKAIDKIK